jgi:hypothetical protein
MDNTKTVTLYHDDKDGFTASAQLLTNTEGNPMFIGLHLQTPDNDFVLDRNQIDRIVYALSNAQFVWEGFPPQPGPGVVHHVPRPQSASDASGGTEGMAMFINAVRGMREQLDQDTRYKRALNELSFLLRHATYEGLDFVHRGSGRAWRPKGPLEIYTEILAPNGEVIRIDIWNEGGGAADWSVRLKCPDLKIVDWASTGLDGPVLAAMIGILRARCLIEETQREG